MALAKMFICLYLESNSCGLDLIYYFFSENRFNFFFHYQYYNYLGPDLQQLFTSARVCEGYNSTYNCNYLPEVKDYIDYLDTNYIYYYRSLALHIKLYPNTLFSFSDYLLYR